jgi:glycerol dehydrogenase
MEGLSPGNAQEEGMEIVFGNPSKYVQGPGTIRRLGHFVSAMGLGNRALIIGGRTAFAKTRSAILEGFGAQGITHGFETFSGEVTRKELDRLAGIGKENQVNFVVGVGGGKALDTAKGVSIVLKLPVAVVPTVAATDAACSTMVATFSEDHVFVGSIFRSRNPELVVVGTDVIVEAPVRFLVAGMGDALSTGFEVEASRKSGVQNFHGGAMGMSSLRLAKWCTDTVLEQGEGAKRAAEQGTITPCVEEVVEAVVFASSVSFENCAGLAAAHALTNGFSGLDEIRPYLHGELVGFFTLVQVVLENQPEELVGRLFTFCRSIGLPVTLAQIGLEKQSKRIMEGTEASCRKGSRIHNEPFPVTAGMVYEALMETDRIGAGFAG